MQDKEKNKQLILPMGNAPGVFGALPVFKNEKPFGFPLPKRLAQKRFNKRKKR